MFKPYAGVSTAVLVFTKTGHGGTDQVWFYDMKADGFSLDDKRTEIADNDIPDIVARFHNLEGERDRKRTEQSFLVPREEIAANDYDLSINKLQAGGVYPRGVPAHQRDFEGAPGPGGGDHQGAGRVGGDGVMAKLWELYRTNPRSIL